MERQKRAQLELGILYRISQAITHQHDVSALLDDVLDIMETEMGFLRGTVTLRRPDSDVFVIETSRGLSSAERKNVQYRVGEGITGAVAQTGQPALVPDISKDDRFLDRTRLRQVGASQATVAFLCVPIVQHSRVIGTISIDRPPTATAELKRDLDFLKLVADLLAESVSRIRADIEERESLLAENLRLRRQLGDRYHPGNLVGNCSSMRQVYEQVAQVADSAATVLVRGESGTGKELVARAIHYSSPRKNGSFITVNCAALPESLIESELFGHEKGAFTGAVHERKGRFELANGGTLFLDEIGDISPSVQVRLLRVLQERAFERVGGTTSVEVNVRVLAATSKNLEEEIKADRFREDLYYRLNVFPIHVPPLRDRRSDIMALADHFVHKYNEAYNRNVRRISTAAINMMMAYHWPGNVRELENCIERAVLLSTDGVIHGHHMPPTLQTAEASGTAHQGTLVESLDNLERELIIDALKSARGNQAKAAGALGITERIMGLRVRKYGINPRRFRDRT